MKKIAIHDCSYSLILFLTIRELVNAGVLGAEVAEEDTGVEWLSSYGDHEFIAVAVEAAAGVNLLIKPLPQGRELSLGDAFFQAGTELLLGALVYLAGVHGPKRICGKVT